MSITSEHWDVISQLLQTCTYSVQFRPGRQLPTVFQLPDLDLIFLFTTIISRLAIKPDNVSKVKKIFMY